MPTTIMTPEAGTSITDAVWTAIRAADSTKKTVLLCFNGHELNVAPGSNCTVVLSQYDNMCNAAYKAYAESPEGKADAAERARERAEQETREAAGPAHDREAMLKAKVPWPATMAELEETISGYVNGKHTYDTAALAMSLAATATFNYVAKVLGTTGFQAGCAVADFKRRNG